MGRTIRIKWWFASAAAVLLAAGGWWVLRGAGDRPGPGDASGADSASPRRVEVARVERRGLPRSVEAIGTLHPYEQATLRAKVSGRIEWIGVDLGDRVEAGSEAARLERQDYQLEVDRAEAQLEQAASRLGIAEGEETSVSIDEMSIVKQRWATLQEAQRHLQRLQQLGGIVSQADLDSAEVAVEVATGELEEALQEARHRLATLRERKATLAIARQDLSETVLRVPFAGAVTRRWVDTGEYVEVGDSVLTLVRTDLVRLRLEVPERLSGRVALGQQIRFRLDERSPPHDARVERISPILEPGNRMLVVEADIPREPQSGTGDDGFRPGSFVQARIVVDPAEPALTVPRAAVADFAGIHKVFVVREGVAAEHPITLGDQGEDWSEVSGIDAGEIVVLNPGNLRSGTAVEIVNEPAPALSVMPR